MVIIVADKPNIHPVNKCPKCGSPTNELGSLDGEVVLHECTNRDEFCPMIFVVSEDMAQEFADGLPNQPDLDDYQ